MISEYISKLEQKIDLTYTQMNEIMSEVLSGKTNDCLLYTSPSPRDRTRSRMPSSA